MFIVAGDFWSGLPSDVRSTLTDAAKEACAYGNAAAGELNATAKQEIMASRYSQIIVLNPEQRARWADAMKPVWATFETNIGRDVMDAALAANGPR